MSLWSALSRLLTVLAVVGLLTGASAAPVAAGSMDAVAETMADGMPPCDQTQQPPDCDDMTACPFAVVCLAKYPQAVPAAASIIARLGVLAAIAPHDDPQRDDFSLAPLGHPPKA